MSDSAAAQRPRPARLSELFGIDARSLAAFRIGLGLLLLVDLWGRAKTLRAHYTGAGVFPRELALELRPDAPFVRAFLLSDRVEVQAALFVLFGAVALALVLGWHTRLASVLAFVLLASLVRRNPYVCHTGDVLLKALSFWAMFLPLGAAASLDRLRRPPAGGGARVHLSLATAAILVQVAVFYVMAGYLKARYDVWRDGEAVWIFTQVVEYTRPFGAWLGQYPGVCRFLTYATLVLEGLAPVLFFAPFGTRWLRVGLFLVFAAFHLTLQAVIHIGIFQLLCIAMLTLFLPPLAWDALARLVPARWRGARAAAETVRVLPARARGRLARVAAGARDLFLAGALAVVLVSNLNSAVDEPYERDDPPLVPLPAPVADHGRLMSLVQSWNMFTDIDRLFFGWFLVLGRDADGTLVDVLARAPFTGLRPPPDVARVFPNHNSRRYWRELTLTDAGAPRVWLQKPMCDWLAREWERDGGLPLTHLAIFHVGRVPRERRERDRVQPVCTEWEAPHEPLKTASSEVRARWLAARADWQRALAGLPRSVAPAE